MISSSGLGGWINTWKLQDTLSKAVILASLLLVLFAYLPTLQYDYATQDQWRAFRYSTEAKTMLSRGGSCTKMIPGFYVITGRPFVWMGECMEHAAVSKISDFAYFRPVMLAIVILTVICLGFVLSPIIRGLDLGILAASAFVMAPGYSFMSLQGMPALMVLISIILAAASFNLYNKRNIGKSATNNIELNKIFTSFILFVSACLIYPAFAYIVIPLALLKFAFSQTNQSQGQLKNFVSTLFFYGLSSISYYVLIKLIVQIEKNIKGELPNLGNYEVAVQMTPKIVWDRLCEAGIYFFSMSPLNFIAPPGLTLAILVVFSISCAYIASLKKPRNYLFILITILIFFGITCILLIGSISPWLFSKMDIFATRHILPWYLFFCAVSVALTSLFIKRYLKVASKWASLMILLGLLLPVALVQNRLSMLEVIVTGSEIQVMRSKISEWVKDRGWINHRFLLVIQPVEHRPAGIDKYFNYLNDNANLATSTNPVSILWMLNALLREHSDYPNIKLVDCAGDGLCVNGFLHDTNKVVVGYTNGGDILKRQIHPFVINLSALTSRMIEPRIVLEESIKINASSMHDDLSPYGLLSSMNPGWHAETPVVYPQKISLDFVHEKSFQKIGFYPQDGYSSRMPKSIGLKVSDDGHTWQEIKTPTDNLCEVEGSDKWHELTLPQTVSGRFVEIEVYSNCGDTNLTLKGLRFE